jgi:hypothetical protein|tara:strand:- start:208 stop:705 length:498 start_codon:yes stop_codon:yes gene_type:complete
MATSAPSAATDALSSIGSDLSFAVSFAIANELLAAAREQQIEDSELIGIVLLTSVSLSALPSALFSLFNQASSWVCGTVEDEKDDENEDENETGKVNKTEAEVGLLGFISFLLQIFQRISLTVLIQLVTSSVQTSQPLRSVRLLSLLSVLFFFVFLKQTATIGSK